MVVQHKRSIVLTFLALLALVFSFSITMAQTPSTGTQVEIIGVIEAKGTNTITVNQQVVDVTHAEVKLTLAVGTVVKVEGNINLNGNIIAREITATDAVAGGTLPGEIEITGLLTALNSTSMTIGGQIFDVTLAEIKDGVAVDQLVKVHATFSNEGIWVAREVELAVQDDDNQGNNDQNDNNNAVDFNNGEFELTGTLTAISTNSITVAGQIIDTSNAEIKDTLLVGALVKVHVSVVNGQLTAREVELARQNNNRGQGNGADSATQQPDDKNNNQGNGNGNNNDDNNHPEDNHNGGDDQGGDNHGGNSGSGSQDGHGGDNGGHGGQGSDDGSGHG